MSYNFNLNMAVVSRRGSRQLRTNFETKEMGRRMTSEPKKPIEGNWISAGRHPGGFVWDSLDGRRVISSVDVISHPTGARPEWHISISIATGRPYKELCELTLRQFDAVGFEEDNHVSGRARHFWLPIDPAKRTPCYCKETEKPVAEGEFVWRPDEKENAK
jgi:hypothetical protein